MTQSTCFCDCQDSLFYNGTHVPYTAAGGGLALLFMSIFFLIFSVVAAIFSFRKNTPVTTYYPPYPNETTENPTNPKSSAKNQNKDHLQNPFG
ncbi:MAG: hypothetical protein Fur0041_13820 [Bacteroidia bacterium]